MTVLINAKQQQGREELNHSMSENIKSYMETHKSDKKDRLPNVAI